MIWRRYIVLCCTALLPLACTGCSLSGNPSSDGGDVLAGEAGLDASSPSDASGGGLPSIDVDAFRPSCGGSTCSPGSRCIGGNCVCDPGFTAAPSGGCRAQEAGDPAARIRSEVCTRWKARGTLSETISWAEAPSGVCETGRLDGAVHQQALRRLNLHRWLVGLDPVTTRPSYEVIAQACATALAAADAGPNGRISESARCYSPEADHGARASNVVSGIATPAAGVELFVEEPGVASLGHRRWVFNPAMGATGFGQRDDYACMYVFDDSGDDAQIDIFYPSPGFFPAAALAGKWSYFSRDTAIGSSATVSVERVIDGKPLEVSGIAQPGGDYGGVQALAWQVDGAQAGTEYRVKISGLGSDGDEEISYRTTLVACD